MMEFPDGREFAFTILDDTDDATVANAGPFYALLRDLGLRTTKTVWPFALSPELQGPFFAAQTLEDADYEAWVGRLAAEGFEIASHNASMGSCTREQTLRGLVMVASKTGVSPRLHCNHGQNRENLYWGTERYRSLPFSLLAAASRRLLRVKMYEGENPSSPYFWGDVAKERFQYVRSFAFARLDVTGLRVPVVYRDATTPWVNAWFVTADAPDADAFARVVNARSIERLHRSGGHVIVSTHVGKGFVNRAGRVHPAVRDALEHLARRPGWFVPASTLLDHLVTVNGLSSITPGARLRLEYLHALDRLKMRAGRH